jgi:hypothetical protein
MGGVFCKNINKHGDTEALNTETQRHGEDIRYKIQDTRYKIQDTRYKIQDTRYRMIFH